MLLSNNWRGTGANRWAVATNKNRFTEKISKVNLLKGL